MAVKKATCKPKKSAVAAREPAAQDRSLSIGRGALTLLPPLATKNNHRQVPTPLTEVLPCASARGTQMEGNHGIDGSLAAAHAGSGRQRSARDTFRFAITQVITMGRLSGDIRTSGGARGSKSMMQAPFGVGTPYGRVRRLLQPSRHRHLLGDEAGSGVVATRGRSHGGRDGQGRRVSAGSSDGDAGAPETTHGQSNRDDAEWLTDAERERARAIARVQRRINRAEKLRKHREALDPIEDTDCDNVLLDDLTDDEDCQGDGGDAPDVAATEGEAEAGRLLPSVLDISAILPEANTSWKRVGDESSPSPPGSTTSLSHGRRKVSLAPTGEYVVIDEAAEAARHIPRHRSSQQRRGNPLSSSSTPRASFSSLSSPAAAAACSAAVNRRLQERRGNQKHKLPSGVDVAQLPPELAQTLFELAVERLRALLYPLLLLRRRLRQRRQMTEMVLKHSNRPTPELLRKHGQMLKDWPLDALQKVCAAMSYYLADAGEFVLYEGEPNGSGVWVLTHGTAHLLRRANRSDKRSSPANARTVATLHNAAIFNELQSLTEEPRLHGVQTVTRCDLWVLSVVAFHEIARGLTNEQRAVMAAHCFRKRVKAIPVAYQLDHRQLREAAVFRHSSPALLDALLPKLVPIAARDGQRFVQEGEPASEVLFLRRGRIGAFRAISGELLHVRTIVAPAVLMDTSVIHKQVSPDTLLALGDCDLFSLGVEEVGNAVAQLPGEREKMFDASRERHMHQLAAQQVKFRPLIFSIPIVRTVLHHEQINALAFLFEGKVYSPMDAVCSQADMCDRVIILVKGKISFGKGRGRWVEGEAAGFTCVLSHRWALSAVALEPSECIEVPRELFVAFLKDCGVYGLAREVAERLMFPHKGEPPAPDVRKRRKQYAYGSDPRSGSSRLALSSTPSPMSSLLGADGRVDGCATPSAAAAAGGALGIVSIDQIVGRVQEHIQSLRTPMTFPVADSREGYSATQPKFAPIKRLGDFGVDAHVLPGAQYRLPRSEREEILGRVLTRFRPEEQRRLTHVTKYLMIKEKRGSQTM